MKKLLLTLSLFTPLSLIAETQPMGNGYAGISYYWSGSTLVHSSLADSNLEGLKDRLRRINGPGADIVTSGRGGSCALAQQQYRDVGGLATASASCASTAQAAKRNALDNCNREANRRGYNCSIIRVVSAYY